MMKRKQGGDRRDHRAERGDGSDDHAGQEVALVSQQSATNDLGANLVAVFLAERRATLLAKKLIARPFV